jgi:hypothetical protein
MGPPRPARSAKRCDPASGCRSRLRGSSARRQDPAASRFVVQEFSGLGVAGDHFAVASKVSASAIFSDAHDHSTEITPSAITT